MRLGTIRDGDTTTAVMVEGETLVPLNGADVGEVLRTGRIEPTAGPERSLADADWAPVVLAPNKIICVGLNYRDHVQEMGHDAPTAPTYFSKFSGALIGANDDIRLPPVEVSTHNDWEAELAVVIGSPARNVSASNALEHIAGYTVLNDFSVRDYQRRSKQFLAGKTFESASGLGPVLVTTDELGDGGGLAITSEVNGVVKQSSNTSELIFGPAELVADLSRIITLLPGDIIATGTPGGVGAARTPPEWLTAGDTVVISIESIGELNHRCVQS